MPGVGFPRSPQDTRKTQDTPIPAVLGKTLTDYCGGPDFEKNFKNHLKKPKVMLF